MKINENRKIDEDFSFISKNLNFSLTENKIETEESENFFKNFKKKFTVKMNGKIYENENNLKRNLIECFNKCSNSNLKLKMNSKNFYRCEKHNKEIDDKNCLNCKMAAILTKIKEPKKSHKSNNSLIERKQIYEESFFKEKKYYINDFSTNLTKNRTENFLNTSANQIYYLKTNNYNYQRKKKENNYIFKRNQSSNGGKTYFQDRNSFYF